MRYTELEPELADGGFVAKIMYLTFLAPHRLLSEISKKLPFLGKTVLEKFLLTSILTGMSVLLMDVLSDIVFGSLSLNGGIVPLSLLILFVLIASGLYLYISMDVKLNINLTVGNLASSLQDSEEEDEIVEPTYDLLPEPVMKVAEPDEEVVVDVEEDLEEIGKELVLPTIKTPIMEDWITRLKEETNSVPLTSGDFLDNLKPQQEVLSRNEEYEEMLDLLNVLEQKPDDVAELRPDDIMSEEDLVDLDDIIFDRDKTDAEILEASKKAERFTETSMATIVKSGVPLDSRVNQELRQLMGGF